jgi:hypothetical protein
MKVGYTKRTVEERMREIFGPKPPDGFPQPYEIVFAAPAYYANGNPFTDHVIHKDLKKLGLWKNNEWFTCSVDQLNDAFNCVAIDLTHNPLALWICKTFCQALSTLREFLQQHRRPKSTGHWRKVRGAASRFSFFKKPHPNANAPPKLKKRSGPVAAVLRTLKNKRFTLHKKQWFLSVIALWVRKIRTVALRVAFFFDFHLFVGIVNYFIPQLTNAVQTCYTNY